MNDQRTLRALLLALLDQPAGATTSDLAHALGEPEATTSTAAAALASRGLATLRDGRVEASRPRVGWTAWCRWRSRGSPGLRGAERPAEGRASGQSGPPVQSTAVRLIRSRRPLPERDRGLKNRPLERPAARREGRAADCRRGAPDRARR
jgi:hypothetical protein